MSKLFVKQEDLKLVNGGYVATGENDTPVSNIKFWQAQKNAEWVITFAKLAKGKDFVGKQAYSISDLKQEVSDALKEKDIKYIEIPDKPKASLTNKLKKEALSFVQYNKEVENNKKVNEFLQRFNIINEFEEFGLFFEQAICKLNKIYTMKDITTAVKSVINLL